MKYLVVLLLLISCSKTDIFGSPKYKAGDCFLKIETYVHDDNEFSKPKKITAVYQYKILKVGNKNYQYEFSLKNIGIKIIDEFPFFHLDEYANKVKCENLK